jgi:WD40 repeat protein
MKGHTAAVNDVAFNGAGTVYPPSPAASSLLLPSERFANSVLTHAQAVRTRWHELCTVSGVTPLAPQMLVSCSSDLSLKLWEFEQTYECLKTLRGHEHSVSGVAFLPGDDIIVSASRDGTIKVWEVLVLTFLPLPSCHSFAPRASSFHSSRLLMLTDVLSVGAVAKWVLHQYAQGACRLGPEGTWEGCRGRQKDVRDEPRVADLHDVQRTEDGMGRACLERGSGSEEAIR